jgi:hypothetical protein
MSHDQQTVHRPAGHTHHHHGEHSHDGHTHHHADHSHAEATTPHFHYQAGEVHTQPAVLDIGEDTGALILFTTPELHGYEIDVSPKGRDDQRVHTAVLERVVNGKTLFAALYMSLEVGEYTIWKTATEPGGEFSIVGGQVSYLDWR